MFQHQLFVSDFVAWKLFSEVHLKQQQPPNHLAQSVFVLLLKILGKTAIEVKFPDNKVRKNRGGGMLVLENEMMGIVWNGVCRSLGCVGVDFEG